jgi:hypothetical protein
VLQDAVHTHDALVRKPFKLSPLIQKHPPLCIRRLLVLLTPHAFQGDWSIVRRIPRVVDVPKLPTAEPLFY